MTALIVSVIAGLFGSYVLYFIGYFLGKPILDKFYEKYEKIRPSINKAIGYTDKHGSKGVFIARLIPIARTLVSLTVGTVRMNFITFTFIFGVRNYDLELNLYLCGLCFWHFFLKISPGESGEIYHC